MKLALAGAARRMIRYELTGRAAELAYYSMLALIPALVVMLGVVGALTGEGDVKKLVDALADATSPTTARDARGTIEGLAEKDTGAGVAIVGGLLTTAWSSSLYTAAFVRGAAAAHGRPLARVTWRRRLYLMPLTVAALLGLGFTLALVIVAAGLLENVADVVGLGALTTELLEIARWPLLVAVLLLLTYGLYRLSPGAPKSNRPSTGAVVAVAAWLVASLGFALYTATLASYESTYGALGGVVSFLVWLWLSNLALLFGVALDAELRVTDATEPGS